MFKHLKYLHGNKLHTKIQKIQHVYYKKVSRVGGSIYVHRKVEFLDILLTPQLSSEL